jgi:CubicO group peptidase (beta-lactamase class C family)
VRPLARAEDVLRRALSDGAYTAVSAEVGGIDGAFWTFAAGHLGRNNERPVETSTVFDLASLTKVISTTSLALVLVREGQLELAAPVNATLAQWSRDDRSRVTITDLLEHCSGLPAHRDYFRRLIGLESYVEAIAAEPLEYEPRTRSIYSDLGFITLGAVLERAGNASLDRQFTKWKNAADINEPLAYRPPAEWRERTALTEHDAWRGRLLQGEVHDENAAALGGVAAHAGLFGTAAAVGAVARWWMRELATELGRRFARRSAVPRSSRALGWDTMLPTSSCGRLMSPAAIGHTGFTGTTLWIDPQRDRYFVLLTNRVHVTRSNEMIQQVRRDFHDAANQDLA